MSYQSDDEAVWQRLVESHLEYARASQAFLAEGVHRVAIIRQALRRGAHRHTALIMLAYLRPAELMQLFDELMFQASGTHGAIQTVRDAILRLPREWLLERIEEAAEPYLAAATDDNEYRRFLELYDQIDDGLRIKLARRAAAHSNPEIREAGEDFL